MSDDKSGGDKKGAEGGEGAESAAPKKGGLSIKTIGVIGAVMALEAGALYFVFGMSGAKKSSADVHMLVHDDSEELDEIEIISDEIFQNMQTGKVWVWSISVYAQVKRKDVEYVETVLAQRRAEVREGLSQIVGRAQHAQLKEPDRQTLNRQFSALIERIVKPDEQGKPRVQRLLISKCTGYPADF
ncbi:MAG: hypothetical protein KF768_06005 [Phycisphaeraceae bacterium]|nr:hypothetical protein [Phycisphaeraceae bacterium]